MYWCCWLSVILSLIVLTQNKLDCTVMLVNHFDLFQMDMQQIYTFLCHMAFEVLSTLKCF